MTQVDYYHFNDDRDLIIGVAEDNGNKPRTLTDRSHLFVFLMFFGLWVGIAIYASSVGEPIFSHVHRGVLDLQIYAVLGFIWLAVLCLGLFFIVINWIPKITICFTNTIILISNIVSFILNIALFPAPMALVPLIIFSFAIFAILLYVLHEVGTDIVAKVIRDASRSMRAFPWSIVIVFIQLALVSFIIFCCASISVYLNNQQGVISPRVMSVILTVINILYCIWMIFFVHHVGRALMHGKFVIWYRAEDKKAIPRDVLSRQMNNTLKYHLGTLAFGSTIFTKFQVVRSMFSNGVHLGNICSSPPKFLCFLIVLGHTTVNALIHSVTQGNHSFESTKYSLNFLMKNHKRFVAVRTMTRLILVFGLAIIPAIPIGFTALYFADSRSNCYTDNLPFSENYPFQNASSNCYTYDVFITTLSMVASISLIMTAGCLYVFDCAIEAVLFSHLHELNANENAIENNIHINQIARENPPDYYAHV